MASRIAREDEALSIGGGSCSAYTANRAATKAQAVLFGCTIRANTSYTDKQLVALKDL